MILSRENDKEGTYNILMKINEPYISREYLALRINYCRQQLSKLPEVTMTSRHIKGVVRESYILKSDPKSNPIYKDSKAGKELQPVFQQREAILSELSKLEGIWYSVFRCEPPADIAPRKVCRKLYYSDNEFVITDSKFFDRLQNDANPYHPEHKTVFYNGTYYRSAGEAEIARYYTEHGIPFKYEPAIWLRGLNSPIYTDFVLLIRELDTCKFHEHFGIKNSSDYSRKTATTYNNYSAAGLLPELDLIYTYNTDDVPFDIRGLETKLNSVIYNSLLLPDITYKQ